MECGLYLPSASSNVFGKQIKYIACLTPSMLLSFGISIQTIILHGNLAKDVRESLIEFLLVFGVCFTACTVYHKIAKHEAQARDTSRTYETTSLFELREYSISELRCHNGSNGTIYMALNGKIFDVTKDKRHYNSGGSYKMLAGRDASRAFATLSFDDNSLRTDYDDLSDLDDVQRDNLYEWQKIYAEKYTIVGKLVAAHKPKTLQHFAMNSIIKHVTVFQTHSRGIERLPLPGILKRKLRNFYHEHME